MHLVGVIDGVLSLPSHPQDWEQRQEEDNLLIERILLLVRNVLHVPADPDEEKVPVLKGGALGCGQMDNDLGLCIKGWTAE